MTTNGKDEKKPRTTPTVSTRLPDGSLVELVYDELERKTALAHFVNGRCTIVEALHSYLASTLVPVPARNNLIRHGVLLLPERADEFATQVELLRDIEEYIARYVDLSDAFLKIASAYVLLSWVYDAFNELPYLRFRGDYGSGKTRALLVVGSICYKPFFASGASTISPIFHTLDTFGGTLIVDESDFRMSDEKAELVKIFNNGNVRGFPVLRSVPIREHVFDPRAFTVFGPKIVAMRQSFDDPALESRFLTEEMGQRPFSGRVPINLPDAQKEEALRLRNKLLWYRFTTLCSMTVDTSVYDKALSPRTNQIIAPLLSVVHDEFAHEEIRRRVGNTEALLRTSRSASPEGQLLEVVLALVKETRTSPVSVAAITTAFAERYGKEFGDPLTPRYVGHLLRNRLRLATVKRHGNFVLAPAQTTHLTVLAERYGLSARPTRTLGTSGTSAGDVESGLPSG
jgi:hypothetical protein